jgi:hypothetical protein
VKGISYFRDAVAAGVSLSPDFVRQVLSSPKCTVKQAAYSALALEQDRVATLRDDLMRRRRELKDALAMVEAQLDELDALRTLERRT